MQPTTALQSTLRRSPERAIIYASIQAVSSSSSRHSRGIHHHSRSLRYSFSRPRGFTCAAGSGLKTRTGSSSATRVNRQVRTFFNGFLQNNGLGSSQKEGLFGVPDLHSPEDFSRLAAEAVKQARSDIDSLKKNKNLNSVRLLDDVSNSLCGVADAAELCRNVHPDKLWMQYGNEAVQLVAEFMSEVNLDREVFDLLRRPPPETNAELLTVHRHMKESMEHEGVGLPDDKKERCLQLLDRELDLSYWLSQPYVDADLWLPKSVLHEMEPASLKEFKSRNPISGDTEYKIPSHIGEAISRMVPNPDARRLVYENSLLEDPMRCSHLVELLKVRQELAQIRGYRDWNAYAQRDSILEGGAGLFLEDAWRALEPKVEEELEVLRRIKVSMNLGESLEPWDIPFCLHNIAQTTKTSEEERATFTYSQLLQGVSKICSDMMGVDFVQETGEGAKSVWHPSVQKFSLRQDGEIVGILYLDCFGREGKKNQSAQFTLRGSKMVNGKRQIPSTALVTAMHPTAALSPSLAMTFMHEIGHALHSLLSNTELQHLSGTRGTVDFVEFPSHLFEFFVTDPEAVKRYTPQVAEQKATKKAPFRHIEAAQQLFFAQVDYNFYSCPTSSLGSPNEVYGHALGPLTKVGKLLSPRALTKFEHLIHYGGSYYCYLLNKAMAGHVWREAFQADPFNQAAGVRLADLFRSGSTIQNVNMLERLLPQGSPRLTHRTPDSPHPRVSMDAMMTYLK